ncbi:hypothetical protein WKV44_10570 [Spirochaetia bacterium 38H-sp]|uniref:Uncharacterized protein n=1 Tax=Rarispira pelagica TaxID=3141764 RepID=A0ABU9UE82_9SPIR
MQNTQKNKKSKWFWLYYFLIALPIAIYNLYDFSISQDKREEFSPIFKDKEIQMNILRNCDGILYGLANFEKIGTITIEIHHDDVLLLEAEVVGSNGHMDSGDIEYYSSENLLVKDISFKPEEVYNGHLIWINMDENGNAYVLVLIKTKWLYQLWRERKSFIEPIKGRVFLFLKTSADYLDSILKVAKKKRSMSINELLYWGSFEQDFASFLLCR